MSLLGMLFKDRIYIVGALIAENYLVCLYIYLVALVPIGYSVSWLLVIFQ